MPLFVSLCCVKFLVYFSVSGRHVEKYVVPEDDSYMTNPNLTISVPIAPGESDVEFPEEEEDGEEEQSEGSEEEEEEDREEVGSRSDCLLIWLHGFLVHSQTHTCTCVWRKQAQVCVCESLIPPLEVTICVCVVLCVLLLVYQVALGQLSKLYIKKIVSVCILI